MLKIEEDYWREDCVAMIGMDNDNDRVVQILPVGQADTFDYIFDNATKANAAKEELIQQWEAFFTQKDQG